MILHAPAGWGKTALLRALHRELPACGQPVAWLTVGEEDAGFRAFLSAFWAACAYAEFPGFDDPLCFPPDRMDEAEAVETLITCLAELSGRHYLVVDSLHLAASRSVSEFFRRLLHCRLGDLTVFMAVRRVPENLALADLRLEQSLREVQSAVE